METREQLLKKHAEWTVKYVEADERLKALLPSVANLSKGEKMQGFILTKESLAEFSKAEEDVKTALNKLQKIQEKLAQLS